MPHPTHETLEKLDDNQVLHLTLRQLQLLGPDAGPQVLCEHRSDGNHPAIGSAPMGMLVANRAGLICPVCSMLGEIKPQRITSSEMALASEAFFKRLPLTPNTLTTVKIRHDEWDEWTKSGEVLANLVTHPLSNFIKALTAELSRGNHPGPIIEQFPLMLLLKVHNLAEHGSQVRHEILGWLETERAINPRNHWMDALTVSDTGELSFNKELHTLAAWRGKQETYFNGASELFDKLKSDLKFVSHFQEKEDEVAFTAPDVTRLFPARPLQHPVRQLKSIAPKLALLVEALEGKPLADVASALQSGLTHKQLAPGRDNHALKRPEESAE
ncbi:TPA: hypothetical protein ACQQJB_003605 [Pseudomonas aeruginosa]